MLARAVCVGCRDGLRGLVDRPGFSGVREATVGHPPFNVAAPVANRSVQLQVARAAAAGPPPLKAPDVEVELASNLVLAKQRIGLEDRIDEHLLSLRCAN